MVVNSLISTPATARVVVSCSCDIILCLERAFSVSSEWVGSKEIKVAAEWYKVNLFDIVHQEVATLIPHHRLRSSSMTGLRPSFQLQQIYVCGMESHHRQASIRASKPDKGTCRLAELESSASSGREDDDVTRRLKELAWR